MKITATSYNIQPHLRSRTPELETSPNMTSRPAMHKALQAQAAVEQLSGSDLKGRLRWITKRRGFSPIPWVCTILYEGRQYRSIYLGSWIWKLWNFNKFSTKRFCWLVFKQTFWDRTTDLCPWRQGAATSVESMWQIRWEAAVHGWQKIIERFPWAWRNSLIWVWRLITVS